MKIENMLGKTFTKVTNEGDEELIFENQEEIFTFYHDQDCCEHVRIEDITGDLSDLVGSPILLAEESTNNEDPNRDCTWTFYKFATIKGYVDIRWLGESNGYYSESVDLGYKRKA